MKTVDPARLALSCLALLSAGAWAADADARRGCIELKTVAETEVETVDAQGQRSLKLVPAATVVPGSQVVWTVTAANVCDKPADKVVIDNPIPAQMSFVPDSAVGAGADILFSTDGRQFAGPAALVVRDATGAVRPARAADYTHIRWSLRNPIAPGQVAMARYRAELK
ncbi:MAG: hypothetical protein MUF07_11505 [Steroidobacteraceae bacterium]|jgi:uncharacterized repeat protein (TIGR01451 family)|nr:hypothetical protein [Steroidobacteraceae bacterium]